MERHQLLGGKLHLYRRGGLAWHCSASLDGREYRKSTKEESLSLAKQVAEDWFFELKGKQRIGGLRAGKTFRIAADQFRREYEVITEGQRHPQHVASHKARIENHLIPFFGDKLLEEITPGFVQEYRVQRLQPGKPVANGEKVWKVPSRSTMHKEIVTLRQVLKTAHRHGWLPYVPDLSPPYKTSGKVTHRAWFSPAEYRQLYMATRQRAKKPLNERWRSECEQLHDLVLFLANTGLRPDEALRLEYRDVTVVKDHDTGEVILEIEVRGKRGVGHCKSTSGAVHPFYRLRKRNKPEPVDRVFPTLHNALFNAILDELRMKVDRDGNRRTIYSLRHTYICLRLMEGADIYQIAKNCRTSVEMIEKHYAVHLKNTLDAAAINVRRARPSKPRAEQETPLENSRLANDDE